MNKTFLQGKPLDDKYFKACGCGDCEDAYKQAENIVRQLHDSNMCAVTMLRILTSAHIMADGLVCATFVKHNGGEMMGYSENSLGFQKAQVQVTTSEPDRFEDLILELVKTH